MIPTRVKIFKLLHPDPEVKLPVCGASIGVLVLKTVVSEAWAFDV